MILNSQSYTEWGLFKQVGFLQNYNDNNNHNEGYTTTFEGSLTTLTIAQFPAAEALKNSSKALKLKKFLSDQLTVVVGKSLIMSQNNWHSSEMSSKINQGYYHTIQ